MGIVVCFPHHARASMTSRAASAVRISAVTPFCEASSVERTDDHHSAGILSRCHHLETVEAPAPASAAMASRESQSSMIFRKDDKSLMSSNLGHLVLKCKANLSLDVSRALGHTVRMPENETEAQFKQEFTGRVKAARQALGWKQWQMANALDMTQDKYKQYEGRSLLPHYLIGRFCLITRIDPNWLMTGHGEKPLQPLKAVTHEPAPPVVKVKTKRRKRAA